MKYGISSLINRILSIIREYDTELRTEAAILGKFDESINENCLTISEFAQQVTALASQTYMD